MSGRLTAARAGMKALLALALVATLPLPAAADSNWWNASWTARRKLTFNNAAQGTDLVAFPVLVRLDATRVDYAKTQNAGQDLRFVDADNATVLPHEIESWNEAGSSYVWVRVPRIDAGSTTDFVYMYYGNPAAADGQNVAAVWDTEFKMVHHLKETSGQHQDSTTSNNDSVVVNVTAQGTATGRVNGADTFVAASAHNVDVADAATLDAAAGESLTVEAWVRSSSASNFMVAVSKEEDGVAEYQLWVQNGNASFWTNYDPDGIGGLEHSARVNSAVNVRNGGWHYLVGRWNGATLTADLYVDGAAAGTPATNALMVDLASANPLVIGEEGDANRGGNFDGDLDEVRVSKVLRSPDWIRAQHLSMTDAFITFGSEPLHTFTDVTARCGVSFARSPLDKVSQRKVVRDKNGYKYLVFGRFRDTGGCVGYQEIRLARSTDGGATWTEVALFGQGGLAWNTSTESFIYPAVDVNPAGDQLHVIVQHQAGRLLYAKNAALASWDQATAWTRADGTRGANNPPVEFEGAEQVNSRSIVSDTAPAIAVDGDGLPHVAYQATDIGNRNVYWQFWKPGAGTWSGEGQISEAQACASSARDVSIDFGRGKDGAGTVKDRVHFLYMKDANCGFGVDTLCYAFAEKTGTEQYSSTLKACTGSGFPPYDYLYLTNGTGPSRVSKGASLVANGGEVWVVGGFDSGGGATVKFAYSSTNGDLWPVGAAAGAQMHSSASPSGFEGYPLVGADLAGHKHRVLSAEGLGASTTRLYGYQWRPRRYGSVESSLFRFRSLLRQDNTAGEVTDSAHVTLEKEKRGADFASCFYVSSGTVYPLAVDEIRCSVEPSVNYRSISQGSKAAYSTGTVSIAAGGKTVAGTGTAWMTNRWGTGDRLSVEGADYIVAAVVSDTRLSITTPFRGQTGGGKAYTLARQFNSLQAWEDCVSGGAAQCPVAPSGSASLPADNRIEVGLVYRDGGGGLSGVTIDGSTTDIAHTITLQAAPGNRHLGNPLAGAYLQPLFAPTVLVKDLNVRVEWLVMRGGGSGVTEGSVRVDVTDSGFNGPIEILNNVMVNLGNSGVVVGSTESQSVVVDVANNVIAPNSSSFQAIRLAPFGSTFNPGSDVYVVNNTAYGDATNGIVSLAAANPAVSLINDIAWGYTASCFNVPSPAAESDFNLSSDATAPGLASKLNVPASGAGGVNFTDPGTSPGSHNYHLLADSVAIEGGVTLASILERDWDSQKRPGGSLWDIGADEFGAPTAVKLLSFVATPLDRSVALEWRTGSELENVGFHVWRGPTGQGPWTRVTPAIIPGAGTSVLGHAYSWLDGGLANGTPYFYRLEDVDTSSVSTFHGPVSAVPGAGVSPPSEPGGEGGSGSGGGSGETASSCPSWVRTAYGAPLPTGASCTRHGDPEAVSFEAVSRDARGATLELRTGGFWALREPAGAGEVSGTVRVYVPGLDTPSDPTAPALPLRRALVEATVGRKVRLVSAEPFELFGFPGMRPSAVGRPEAAVFPDGTVRPARRAVAAPRLRRGYLPQLSARLAPSVFQGERKSAVVEIFPVRFDGYRQQLVLARRVRVRVAFTGVEAAETGSGSTGRLARKRAVFRDVLAQLHTTHRGLHAVSFEELFPGRQRPMAASLLHLQRQGEAVPFRIEPPSAAFGPGNVLYFFADRVASSTDFTGEVAWELVRSSGGLAMDLVLASPEGAPSPASVGVASFEVNRFYMPDLLEAPDPWLWQAAIASPGSPVTAAPLSFSLSGVDVASLTDARLVVHLQGGSESGYTTDHHLEVRLNGSPVAETSFSGKKPHRFDLAVPAASLLEGANTLTLVNLADTGVTSRVFLDRFSVSHPQAPALRGGLLEGTWAEPGVAEVAGAGPASIVLDTTPAADSSPVKWLLGAEPTGSSLRFRAEAGRRYLVVSPHALLRPRVSRPAPSPLRDTQNQADFILVAPRGFLDAAQPLLDRRQGQGLTTAAVSFEEIAETFGRGQPSPEAIRDFLSFAFHSWARPSPRYVLLLGDSTFDPRRFQVASTPSPLPALWEKTSYLLTASDPALAAVNGTDLLPDLAIGRLPARSPDEAAALVHKILAFEDSGQNLDGNTVLVADNPDEAGDFEADVEDIRASFLANRPTQLLRLSELGSSMRPAVKDAFDRGASLVSYVGHGGAAVWASENVWNAWDTPSLLAQSRQPLLLTLNCLNGYFVASTHDALAEALLKAPARGAIAAVSPSGLSLDGPAHQYHRALMAEITSGNHERLGDALLAAQRTYAQAGLMPELLAIYHLLGDPATKIR
jgi:hypothetical protein